MCNKWVFLVVCLGMVNLLWGCDNVDSGDTSSYIDEVELGGLDSTEAASGGSNALVGKWVASFADGTESVTFAQNGSGLFEEEWTDGTETYAYSEALVWELDGSVLSVAIEEEFTDEGLKCSGTEQLYDSIAIVDNGLVLEAFIRTIGSGSGYVGTWNAVMGEIESYQCGDDMEEGGEIETVTLELTSDSFVMTSTWKYWESWDESGQTGSETDNGVDKWEGTVIAEDGYLVLQANDDELYPTVFTVRVLADGVAQVLWDEPDYALEEFEDYIYYRQ